MIGSAARRPSMRTSSELFAYASARCWPADGWRSRRLWSRPSRRSTTSGRQYATCRWSSKGVAWLLGFPFVAGLAIWQASWDEAVRLTVVSAVLAVAYAVMFVPRVRKRWASLGVIDW